jgi:CRISPR-associated protein Cas2
MVYSICYDIKNDRCRVQVAKSLADFGKRVQFSVLEANLGPDDLAQLIRRVSRVLHPEEDNLRIYPLCASCASRIEILGHGTATQTVDFIII